MVNKASVMVLNYLISYKVNSKSQWIKSLGNNENFKYLIITLKILFKI